MKHETYFPDTMNHHDLILFFFVLCFVFPTLVLPSSIVLMSLSAAPKTIRWRILCDDGTDEQQRKSAENILDDLTLLIRERYRTVEFKLNPNEYLAAVE